MKSPQRRSSSPSPVAVLRSELERLRAALRELAGAGRQSLQPALVPIPVSGLPRPPRDASLAAPTRHLAFGRRKDSKGEDEADGDGAGAADAAEPDLDELPPIPSALGAGEKATDPVDEAATEDAVGAWRPLDSSVVEGADQEDANADSISETPAEESLPSWSSRPYTASAGAAAGSSDLEPEEPAPWGTASPDAEPTTFTPAVVDPNADHPENLSWLQSGAAEGAAPWAVQPDAPAADGPTTTEAFTDPVTDLDEIAEIDEIEPETPQEDEATGAGPEGLDSFSEVLSVAEEPWSSPAVVVEEAIIYQPAPAISMGSIPDEQVVLETRSFPLPEGDVVFRNLRAGFTDPSRLLRHLAGEGHTGVLHVQGVDQSNSYVVLVDGYVVAVATDRQGHITTTNRIAFPNFPNSQDTINVITYPRQIARGLGLVLHAPVRFAGLGAMFVNLEGLRSYLSKYSSSGGLIVHAQDGIGVALFEDGKLVGAYANGNSPTSDLGQLRELVKDLEAEIDVRFGGPQELEPTPLDTLLSGYPL
ncbi:MAG TPA: hypothetical protein VMW80_08140 [Candidatus Dormibacteraeota bacterium]|nr:hypothetical protein [Candidatus Dormibacteraeota bacterium]